MQQQQPLIVSARLASYQQDRLNASRKLYFPKERNHLDAHLTLFHALPHSSRDHIDSLLRELTAGPPLKAYLAGVMPLGRGFAVKVTSPDLVNAHAYLQQSLWQHLSPQDQQALRPHITLQNKVDPAQAKADRAVFERTFVPEHSAIVSLCLWHYQGGPWAPIKSYAYTGEAHAYQPPN